MKTLKKKLLLLSIVFYSCSSLPSFLGRDFCTDIRKVQFESITPGGTIFYVTNLDIQGNKDCNPNDKPIITDTEGSAGLKATIDYSNSLKYDGKLTCGNDFGECYVRIKGTYPKCNKNHDSWVHYGTVSISKPTIILRPKTILIDTFGTYLYYATILPICKYTVKISNPDNSLEISPRSTCKTYKSSFSLAIKDLKGTKRTSTVTLTIASDCDSSIVSDSLNVIVM